MPGFDGFRLQDGLLWAEGAGPGDPGHPVTTLYVGNLPPQVWDTFFAALSVLMLLQECGSVSVRQQQSRGPAVKHNCPCMCAGGQAANRSVHAGRLPGL